MTLMHTCNEIYLIYLFNFVIILSVHMSILNETNAQFIFHYFLLKKYDKARARQQQKKNQSRLKYEQTNFKSQKRTQYENN